MLELHTWSQYGWMYWQVGHSSTLLHNSEVLSQLKEPFISLYWFTCTPTNQNQLYSYGYILHSGDNWTKARWCCILEGERLMEQKWPCRGSPLCWHQVKKCPILVDVSSSFLQIQALTVQLTGTVLLSCLTFGKIYNLWAVTMSKAKRLMQALLHKGS